MQLFCGAYMLFPQLPLRLDPLRREKLQRRGTSLLELRRGCGSIFGGRHPGSADTSGAGALRTICR